MVQTRNCSSNSGVWLIVCKKCVLRPIVETQRGDDTITMHICIPCILSVLMHTYKTPFNQSNYQRNEAMPFFHLIESLQSRTPVRGVFYPHLSRAPLPTNLEKRHLHHVFWDNGATWWFAISRLFDLVQVSGSPIGFFSTRLPYQLESE